MINREIIRIKIVQLTYAYYQNGNKNIDTAEKELFFSLSKAYDLYNQLLSLIVAITREAQRRQEVLQAKALREGSKMPSAKFISNRFALQLESNIQLGEFMETQKRTWADYPEFIGKMFEQIEQSQIYQDYMNDKEDSYAADREVWRKLYRTFEEKDYARKLFRATILNANDYQHMMTEASQNWDFSRLAYMDVIIMQIAIAEMLTFPSIPLSVTINEFVELAKFYSTPRSAGYINGMLDTIARHLINTGRLLKQMDKKDNN